MGVKYTGLVPFIIINSEHFYKFLSSINGVSQTLKKQILFSLGSVSQHKGRNERRPTRRHYKAIHFVGKVNETHSIRYSSVGASESLSC